MADWLIDDESELLGDTLSLLASWDDRQPAHDGSSLNETANPSLQDAREQLSTSTIDFPATGEARKKPKAPRRINTTRERLKGEIEMLRRVSTQLQTQLQELQQRREEMLRPHFTGDGIQSTVPIWENMARGQFQSRRRTEEHNAKLREKIATQARVARELMNAIQSAMQQQTLQDERPTVRLPVDVSQRFLEEEQFQRLEQNVPRWQWALSLSPSFERGELQFIDFEVEEVDGESAKLYLYTSKALPYPVTRVAEVTWWLLQQETSGYGEDEDDEKIDKYVHEHETTDDTISAMFTMESTMGGATATQGTVHGKWVAKQASIQDAAQCLISTTWQYELSDFGSKLDGVSVLEDTWLRIVNAKDIGHAQLAGSLAVMQQVRELEIHFNCNQPVDRRHVAVVTELFIKQLQGELKAEDRALENAVMAQPVKLE